MQRETEIINGLLFKPMMVRRRKCIVVMHGSDLVMRADKFKDLIVKISEMQVERLDGVTIFISEVIVFP
jgi:hypothetical protein